jgi:protein O-GlcNAc transferase
MAADQLTPEAALAQARQLHRTGQLGEAEQLYRSVLEVQPDNAEANHLLGMLAYQVGRFADAAKLISMAILADGNQPPFYNNLGLAMQAQGNGEQAILLYRQAIALDPAYADAHSNLGIMLETIGKYEEALAEYDQAIALDTTKANAHNSRGIVLHKLGRFDAAIEALHQAITIEPEFAEAHNNLANSLEVQGRIGEAIAAYKRVLVLNPAHAGAHSNLLLCMNYDANTDAASLFAAHQTWNEKFTSGYANLPIHNNLRDPERPLRIGYVSADFHFHPVSRFFEPILRTHDRDNFEITCYSNANWHDTVAERLKGYTDHWCGIADMDDDQVVARIMQDGIDILVDLSGHTAGNRLSVFARKPAPVQATYIGYPSTTGLSAMDYRISDHWIDPEGMSDTFHTEEIIRLPNGSFCFTPYEHSPDIGLRRLIQPGQVTFASFNNTAKINREVIALWSAVMQALPDSRMLLAAKALDDASTVARLKSRFSEYGVDPQRLEFLGWSPIDQHLALYNGVDIGLDTFPWCGNTTTCDALWMGVPVITMAQNESRGRMGVSVLNQAGLNGFIAESPDDFVAKAVALARDPNRLQQLRSSLRAKLKQSPLLDGHTIAVHLENAYRNIWRRWCADTRSD